MEKEKEEGVLRLAGIFIYFFFHLHAHKAKTEKWKSDAGKIMPRQAEMTRQRGKTKN